MKQEAFGVTLAVLFLVLMTCLVSIMALFMGGGQASTDLYSLLMMQATAIPTAWVIVVFCTYVAVRKVGWGPGLRTVWNLTPQWLVFIFFLLSLLGIFGEIALVVKARLTSSPGGWQEHVPLVCLISCAAAFLVLYSRMQLAAGKKSAMSGRW